MNRVKRKEAEVDVIAVWQGFGDVKGKPFGNWDSKCRVRIYNLGSDITSTEPVIVICSDLGDDSGTSITNCAENLHTRIKRHWDIKAPLMWIEEYKREASDPFRLSLKPKGGSKPKLVSDFSEVFHSWNGERYIDARWRHLSLEEVLRLGISLEESTSPPEVRI